MAAKTEEKKQEKKQVNPVKQQEGKKLAVVLVRGFARLRQPLGDTLAMLKLNRKNTCVLVNDTPSIQGMLIKVKDFIAWGEVTTETVTELFIKRGILYTGRLTDSKRIYSYKSIEFEGKKYYPYFYLMPPRQGFGRKGIKLAYNAGGALGYRGEKINDLIQRMI